MDRINNLAEKFHAFFNNKADDLAISTRFIKRRRKLKGSSFVKAMVLGNMGNGLCSIESLCQLLNEEAIEISKQGVDFRFTTEAVVFMQSMFYEAIRIFKNDLPIECEVLNYFKRVKLLDSTNINLPNNMEDIYKGCGASYEGHESVTKSAIKLQTVFDYLHQTIERLDVTEGIRADQGYKDHLQDVVANDLLICDLGYFVPANFKKVAEIGAYFLSRYKTDTNVYDINTQEKIELLKLLNNQSFLEEEVLLGKETKLKVRIICTKLTPEQSIARRRKANKLAKSHGYKSSAKNQALLDWSIFITNISASKIKAEQIYKMYTLRWQIELLFKLYKSHLKLANLKGKNKTARILCELYAKLCVSLLFHGLTGCIELKQNTELSFTKAIIELKRRARELFISLSSSVVNVCSFLQDLLSAWSKFSLKDKHRKSRLSTLSALKSLTSHS
jgi:Transposase DDE domain